VKFRPRVRRRAVTRTPPLASRSQAVFVGGTGRSGTTIVAKLLGAHPAYHMIPIEVRFVVDRDGLCDVLEGRTSFGAFQRKLLGRTFRHENRNGETRGLSRLLERPVVVDALHALEDEISGDKWSAGRDFVHRLLDPVATTSGAEGWIEMTPPNVMAARSLVRLFPDLRLVHAIRDGRDVAASVAPLWWGPNDLDDALEWWADRFERGFAACESLPAHQVLVVQMEDLVVNDREGSYARLLEFLDLDDAPEMRTFQRNHLRTDLAHIGRWVDEVPRERRGSFDEHYARLCEGLRARGRPIPSADRLPAR
jgi:hypothetical protein